MKNTLKNFSLVFLIGVVVFLIGQFVLRDSGSDTFREILISFGFYQLYAFVLGYSNMYFFKYLEKMNWREDQGAMRTVFGVVGAVLITLLGLFVLRMAMSVFYFGMSFQEFISGEKFRNYTFGLSITLIIVLIFHLIYFYNKAQKKKVKDSQIVAKTESARFASLKSQLDPHFLFNSLNVLTSLIGENPMQAERFTTKLSKIYRYVLEQRDKDITSVAEELGFAHTYMELLGMRFENAITYDIPNKVSDPELKIVPLSLQLLLENAVKHNVISASDPLQVRIFEDKGYLIVENNRNPKKSLEKSTKVGLKNIRQRYALISGREVVIEESAKSFRVKLPLLTQNISMVRNEYMNESEKYLRARKRVDELKEFYGSLIAYFLVIPFLIFVNYRTSWHFQWFWFPMLGWGLGLVVQAFKTFGYGGDWEERKIRELMEKERNNKYR